MRSPFARSQRAFTRSGTLAARPAANVYGVGYYFATNDKGGTMYFSDGATWTNTTMGRSVDRYHLRQLWR